MTPDRNIYETEGERMCARHFEVEMRAGVPHYKPGQLQARIIGDEEALFVFLTWADSMGHAVAMPVLRQPDGPWETMGVYRRAGHYTVQPPAQLDEDYKLPEKTVAFLEKMEKEQWQLPGN